MRSAFKVVVGLLAVIGALAIVAVAGMALMHVSAMGRFGC
jgi:hypothetical protein